MTIKIGGMLISKLAGSLFDHYKDPGHIKTGYFIMFLFRGLGYLIA